MSPAQDLLESCARQPEHPLKLDLCHVLGLGREVVARVEDPEAVLLDDARPRRLEDLRVAQGNGRWS